MGGVEEGERGMGGWVVYVEGEVAYNYTNTFHTVHLTALRITNHGWSYWHEMWNIFVTIHLFYIV